MGGEGGGGNNYVVMEKDLIITLNESFFVFKK